jgi:hypothetical protein
MSLEEPLRPHLEVAKNPREGELADRFEDGERLIGAKNLDAMSRLVDDAHCPNARIKVLRDFSLHVAPTIGGRKNLKHQVGSDVE